MQQAQQDQPVNQPQIQDNVPNEQQVGVPDQETIPQTPNDVLTPPENNEKYKIEKVDGFDVLKVKIENDDSIYVKYDGQMVIDNSLKMEAVTGSKKGFFSGLWASASTGSVFINRIFLDPNRDTNNSNSVSGNIHISGIFPGTITEIDINYDKPWLIASHCFLACTGDVEITTRANLNIVKLVAGVNLFFTELKVPEGKTGKAWVTSFGGTYEKEVNESTRNFRINPGLFMAAEREVADGLKTIGSGSLGAIFATGQFLMMDFSQCPSGKVYLQTTNENYMIYKLSNKINDSNASVEFASNILDDIAGGDGAEHDSNNVNNEYINENNQMGGGFDNNDINYIQEYNSNKKRRHTRRLGGIRRSRTKRYRSGAHNIGL